MTVTPAQVDDDLRSRMAAEFSEKQLVELAHAIAWENTRARFNRAFDVQSDGYAADS